jgi:uncharacterized protein YggE
MLVLSRRLSIACLLVNLGLCGSTFSQAPENIPNRGTYISLVSTQDTAVTPEKLRLLILAKAESRDSKRAYQSMLDHQKRVSEELVKEGAIASSIEFTKPIITSGVPGVDDPEAAKKRVKQQAAQMRNINLRGRQPAEEIEDDVELPLVYTASSRIFAEWSLPTGDDESTSLLPSKIRGLIDQYDWKGKALRVALNEEEQKLIAPLTAGISLYSTERAPPEVLLFFVGRSTEAQDEEAAREAIKKAQNQATILAKGIGKKVSGIRSISLSPMSSSALTRGIEYGSAAGQNVLSMIRKDNREAIQEDANFLRQTISVSIQFDLE